MTETCSGSRWKLRRFGEGRWRPRPHEVLHGFLSDFIIEPGALCRFLPWHKVLHGLLRDFTIHSRRGPLAADGTETQQSHHASASHESCGKHCAPSPASWVRAAEVRHEVPARSAHGMSWLRQDPRSRKVPRKRPLILAQACE